MEANDNGIINENDYDGSNDTYDNGVIMIK